MVSSVNFGSIFTAGGKTLTSGTASGIDVKSIVEQLYNAKIEPTKKLDKEITFNKSKVAALGELRTKFDNFRNSLNSLRNPPGALNTSSNIFKSRQTFITSNTSVAGNTYIGVTAQSGAELTSYDITVNALAKAKLQRTNAFTSSTASVTDMAGTNNPNSFSAGTFQIAGGQVTNDISTPASDILLAGDYRVVGSVTGGTLDNTFGVGGINNISVGTAGEKSFIDSLSSAYVSGAQIGGVGANVTLTARINGKNYISNAIAANTGGGSNEIAAGSVITFTDAVTNTSFEVRTTAATVINSTTDLENFAASVDTSLGGVTIYQQRTISAYSSSLATGTTLNGLTAGDVLLDSNKFDPFLGTHGKISDFKVTAVTGPGNADGTIEFTMINNDGSKETFRATGLGGAVGDTQTADISINSLTTGKSLKLNIGLAGITLNFSNNLNAKTIEKDLNTVFGTGVNINLADGDSLNAIANKINSQTSKSNVSASVVKVADGDFRLTMQSTKTGIENAYRINDAIDDTFSSTVTFNNIQTAVDSSFTLNGQTIVRASNNVNDVVKNITFNLFQETPLLTTLKVDVDKNIQGVADTITNLVATYNDVKTFQEKQLARNVDGTPAEGAFLGDSIVLDSSINSILSELNRIVSGIAGSPNRLSDVGITFVDIPENLTTKTPAISGALQIDDAKLVDAITTNFENVRKVFEADFTTPNADKLQLFTRTNAITFTDFDLDIDIARAPGTQAQITYINPTTGLPVTIDADFTSNSFGGTVTGKAGTAAEGLVLLYVGNGNDTINGNKLTQGVGDRVYNILDAALTETTGSIDLEKSAVTEENTDLEDDKSRIIESADSYRERLFVQFSNLEAVLSKVNNTLALLDALDKSRQAAANQ